MKSLLKALRIAAKTDRLAKDINAGIENTGSGSVDVTFRQGERRMMTTMLTQTVPDPQKYTLGTLPGNTLVDS